MYHITAKRIGGCCGSTALKARVLVSSSDAAGRKHVLALVPCVPGFRPGQPTFKGIHRCALLRATHPHRSSSYFWTLPDCVEHSSGVVPPTSRVCDPSEVGVPLHLPAMVGGAYLCLMVRKSRASGLAESRMASRP